MWFPSTGVLKYGPGIKAALAVDQSISDLYRWFVPKHIDLNPQRYPAHVSVVRREKPNMDFWRKHEGRKINFEYSNEIIWDETYYWLNVRCPVIEEIRAELGLTPYPWWVNSFHVTIGNVKAL